MEREHSPNALDAEADRLVARERARVNFIIGVIRDELRPLMRVFVPEELPSPADAAEVLFQRVQDAIRTLELQVIHPALPAATDSPSADKWHTPLLALGWAVRYRPTPHPHLPGVEYYTLWPTERGFELIDGLRAATGQMPVAQERRRNDEALRERLAEMERKVRGDGDNA